MVHPDPAKRPYGICARCVLDTTVPEIRFDAQRVCQYCAIHDELARTHPIDERGESRLKGIIEQIKKDGRGKPYDCIVGVSGGRDSTTTLYRAKKFGLRPLAVHFDNGWDTEVATRNIRNATAKLDVDLHTVVADWEEFKDLQRSFLLAGVSDAEVPSDYVVSSVLFKTAAEQRVKYILEGHSFRTEGTSPRGWTYMDGRYLRSVHKRYGTRPIRSFPILTLSGLAYASLVRRIRYVRLLEYGDYNQAEATRLLETEVGWTYYGGHHHESEFTKFFQTHYLPKKFGIDKRKIEFSALIRSGQISRDEALRRIKEEPYEADAELVDYCLSKLGFTRAEYDKILAQSPKTFRDFPTYFPALRALALPVRLACRLNLLPRILALKYLD